MPKKQYTPEPDEPVEDTLTPEVEEVVEPVKAPAKPPYAECILDNAMAEKWLSCAYERPNNRLSLVRFDIKGLSAGPMRLVIDLLCVGLVRGGIVYVPLSAVTWFNGRTLTPIQSDYPEYVALQK